MRHRTLLTTLAVALLLPALGQAQSITQKDGRPVKGPDSWLVGAYDPHGDFTDDKSLDIEHLFLPWEDIDLSTLPIAYDYASARNREIWITVEPWTWDRSRRIEPNDLRNGMREGVYDGVIDGLCGEVGRLKRPTVMRWAQEMEETTGQFVWAGWAPSDYIAAYRHFVERCRIAAPNATFMWSPKGIEGLEDYYPGDDVVDSIGLSIFGLQQMDHDRSGRDHTFAEYLKPAYDRVLPFGKPIYVAELGYVGDANYVAKWARDSTGKDATFPQLFGVAYFNDKEVAPWPEHYGLPDWRVTNNIVE